MAPAYYFTPTSIRKLQARTILTSVPEEYQETVAKAANHELPTMLANYALVDHEQADERIVLEGSNLFQRYMLDAVCPQFTITV